MFLEKNFLWRTALLHPDSNFLKMLYPDPHPHKINVDLPDLDLDLDSTSKIPVTIKLGQVKKVIEVRNLYF
jgi:hypothetical protein